MEEMKQEEMIRNQEVQLIKQALVQDIDIIDPISNFQNIPDSIMNDDTNQI